MTPGPRVSDPPITVLIGRSSSRIDFQFYRTRIFLVEDECVGLDIGDIIFELAQRNSLRNLEERLSRKERDFKALIFETAVFPDLLCFLLDKPDESRVQPSSCMSSRDRCDIFQSPCRSSAAS